MLENKHKNTYTFNFLNEPYLLWRAFPIHDYMSNNANLENYGGLIDHKEYIQNVRSILELVIQVNNYV